MAFFDGFSSIVRGIGNALTGTISVVGGLLGDLFGRFLGIGGFFLDLIGLRKKKKLWLKFIILLDENATELIPQENLGETFKITKRILDEQADIEVIQTGVLIAGGAPEGALDVTSPTGSFFELWGEVGAYFNSLAGIGPFTRRLSVIIVRTMEEHEARSFGPTANFILITKTHFANPKEPEKIVAHEIGHACGLLHREQKVNLMYHTEDDRGEKLTNWQSAVMRGSKFVWYY